MDVEGMRKIEFLKDGGEVKIGQHSDSFKNTIFGTLAHQFRGTVTYMDEKNGIYAELKLGGVKKKPKDFFSGIIKMRAANNPDKWVEVTQIYGTYLGFIEFDGVRYWDLRENNPVAVNGVPYGEDADSTPTANLVLPSDSRLRQDSMALRAENVEAAQENKNAMEARQRADAALRKVAE